MPRLYFLIVILMTSLGALAGQPVPASSPDSIWSGVVLATTVGKPAAPAEELALIEGKMKGIFGYNQYELVGRHVELMDSPCERWLIPSNIFCLRVNSKRGKDKTYLLNLQLFQRTKMLTEFNAKVTAQSPLVIRGPLCKNGQLLFVLMVQ